MNEKATGVPGGFLCGIRERLRNVHLGATTGNRTQVLGTTTQCPTIER